MSGREDVLETTGCESYADVSLLFDTLHWPERRRRPAMEEAYRRLNARASEVRELRKALRPFAAFACGSDDGSGAPLDGCDCHNCNAARLLPEPPEAPE